MIPELLSPGISAAAEDRWTSRLTNEIDVRKTIIVREHNDVFGEEYLPRHNDAYIKEYTPRLWSIYHDGNDSLTLLQILRGIVEDLLYKQVHGFKLVIPALPESLRVATSGLLDKTPPTMQLTI
jgi:hypothetical protein